jgi:hypothetical protein
VKYVNPLYLFNVAPHEVVSLDASAIKKLRRKLFSEIELSDDGVFHLDGVTYTRSECEKAVDSLEDQSNIKHHAYLLHNKPLFAFITNGDTSIFQAPQLESAYLDGGFQNFINPYFAPRYDKVLLEAFRSDAAGKSGGATRTMLDNVLKLGVLINASHESVAYRGLTTDLLDRVEQIKQLSEDINEEESEYEEDNAEDITKLIKNLIPVDSINKLPFIFQSTRNKLAAQANYVALAVNGTMDISKVSFDILDHVLKLNIDSSSKPTFERNKEIWHERYLSEIEEEKYSGIIHIWVNHVNNITEITEKVTNKLLKPNEIKIELPLDELNKLDSFADEIRDTVAKRVRELSVAVWNTYKDHTKSIQLIQIACSIRTSKEVSEQLREDEKQLVNLKEQSVEVAGVPIKSAPMLHLVNGCGTTLYGSTLYIVIFGIPVFPIARYNYESSGNHYRFRGKLKLHTYQVWWRYIIFALLAYILLNALGNS